MRLSPLLLVIVFACRSPPSPQSPAASEHPVAVAAKGRPSLELARYFHDEEAPISGYIDWTGAKGTTLVKDLIPSLIALVDANPKVVACARQVHVSVSELLFTLGDPEGDYLILATFDPAQLDLGACLEPEATPLPGADAVYRFDGQLHAVLAVRGSVLFVGARSLVAEALLVEDGHADFHLGPDHYGIVRVSYPMVKGTLGLIIDDRRFALDVDVALGPDAAKNASDMLEMVKIPTLATAMPAERADVVKRLQDALSLQVSDGHARGAFELRGTPNEQARDLSVGASLGVEAVKRYLASAEEAEARFMLTQIRNQLLAWYERDRPNGKRPTKLISLPAVPKTMPSGRAVQTSSDDWAGWKPIECDLAGPQRFQYELIARKGGKSALLVARGDLRGDGGQTQLSVTVTLDEDGLTFGHEIRLTQGPPTASRP